MLTVDQARTIANKWRERFDDPESFVTSWTRYMDMVKHDRSPEGLENWLRSDAEKDEVRAVGLNREPLLPVRQDLPDLVDDCTTCRGKRWLRRDLPVGHPEFGKALRCPHCRGRA